MYLVIQNIPCHLVKNTAGHSFGENVSLHPLPLAVLDVDLAVFDSVGDEQVLHMEMSRTLGGGMSLLRKGNGRGVVMQNASGTYLVPELNKKVAGPDHSR